jgi:hypothetical protein
VKRLIDIGGINVNRPSARGQLPLSLAFKKRDIDMVLLLLRTSRVDILLALECIAKIAADASFLDWDVLEEYASGEDEIDRLLINEIDKRSWSIPESHILKLFRMYMNGRLS